MFVLKWKNKAIDANKALDIQVPVGSVVSNKASLTFTGKGAANYGTIQQENLMRLLESFADSVAPAYPTVGQEWYDTANATLKVCASTSPLIWKSLGGIQVTSVGAAPPSPAALGDIWFQRTGASSGFMYIYTGIGRYPSTATTVGGWSQVWPSIEMAAGREEYDLVLSLVNQLISTPHGGSGALDKVITNLSPLQTLDNDMAVKWLARAPIDSNVLTPISEERYNLGVDPDSNDWDTLLAAAKYAVNRLELPPTFVDDISPVPFVFDGRQAPSSLTSLADTDVRYPSVERRSRRRFGMVTLVRSFTETLNVLSTATASRYSLKGVNGGAFASNVTTYQHARFQGSPNGAATASVGLRFNFPNAAAKTAFLNGGGIIQVTLSHALPTTPTPGDNNMKTLLDQRGVLRITNDKVRIFANILPLQIFSTTSPGVGTSGTGTTLTSQTLVSGGSYNVTAAVGTTWINVVVTCTSSGPMNGTLTINHEIIRDTSTYTAPAITEVYPGPLAYQPADKFSGSSFMS